MTEEATPVDTSDMLNVGKINERLTGVKIAGQFIEDTLKIEPAHRDKRAVFWTQDQFGQIMIALARWAELQASRDFALNPAAAPKTRGKEKPAADPFAEAPAPKAPAAKKTRASKKTAATAPAADPFGDVAATTAASDPFGDGTTTAEIDPFAAG